MITQEQAFGMYLGKKVLTKDNTIEELIAVNLDGSYAKTYNDKTMHQSNWYFPLNHCKLILRPYDDMTEEEIQKLYSFEDSSENEFKQSEIKYLISIGIDVFNFKSKDWAIYEEGDENERN